MIGDIILQGLLIGGLLGFIGLISIPLSVFLQHVEDEENCIACKRHDECFAKRSFLKGRYVWLDEWMLISFLVVRRGCRYNSKISVKAIISYLLFSCGGIWLLFWSKGVDTTTYLYCVSVGMLMLLSVVDWNTQFIPLECNIVILICGLIRLFADVSNWLEYVIGLIAVSGFLLFVDRVSTPILRKKYEGEMEIDRVIGDGDIKLMAATGLLLGWKLNFLALGVGCIIGSIIHIILMKIKESERKFALGPYLSLGVYITMICGEQLISWYLNIMGVVPMK